MEQHPIPQDITSYKFHLVGDMTLKQFVEAAGGLGFAWLIYSTPLNPLIKWPLLIFSALFGAALAFFPLEERPLDVWIVNFFKAIYRPTQYFWQKTNQIPDFLKPKAKKPAPKNLPVSPKDRKKLEEYLSSLPFKEDTMDKEEKEKLNRINKFFQESSLADKQEPSSVSPPTFYEPKKALDKFEATFTQKEPFKKPPSVMSPREVFLKKVPKIQEDSQGIHQGPPIVEPAPPFAPPLKVKTEVVYQEPPEEPQKEAVAVQVVPSLSMPPTPYAPNILVGMTLTPKGEILTDTIIEIQDENRYPVRALKSNKVGQFFIATPLPAGKYKIEAEHPNYKFDIMEITLKKEVIPPIQIKAKEEIL